MKREFIRDGAGVTPAVALVNPKYGHNVGAVLRNCAVFGIRQLWITGERAIREWEARGRLPREERMRSYGNVQVCLGDRFFDAFPPGTPSVAVEVRGNSEVLSPGWQHPGGGLYVFGPEDGSLHKAVTRHCHRFLVIPSAGCLNLAVASGIVLSHRYMQQISEGLEEYTGLDERGFCDSDGPLEWKP